jgi:hypothetical protein
MPTEPNIDSDALRDITARLLEQLMRDGRYVVLDPDSRERAMYRRAIHRIITERALPDGHVLRHTGRDTGDLVIRLEQSAPRTTNSLEPDLITVAKHIDQFRLEVQSYADEGRLAVSASTLDRALRILQAIGDECASRGWSLTPPRPGHRWLVIAATEREFSFSLAEEFVDREVPDESYASQVKYDWQRVPLRVKKVGSGRLVLRLEQDSCRSHGERRRSWGDRRNRSLDYRLGEVFAEMAKHDAAAGEQRRRREEDLMRRQQAWDAAFAQAKSAYIDHFNRRRVRDQATDYAASQRLVDYGLALRIKSAASHDEEVRATMRDWASWADDAAADINPLNDVATLRYIIPDNIKPSDLDPFMPKGMRAQNRPRI